MFKFNLGQNIKTRLSNFGIQHEGHLLHSEIPLRIYSKIHTVHLKRTEPVRWFASLQSFIQCNLYFSNFILKHWWMRAVCVGPLSWWGYAGKDRCNIIILQAVLCCRGVWVFIANSKNFLMPAIRAGWYTSTWGWVTLHKGVQQYWWMSVPQKRRNFTHPPNKHDAPTYECWIAPRPHLPALHFRCRGFRNTFTLNMKTHSF